MVAKAKPIGTNHADGASTVMTEMQQHCEHEAANQAGGIGRIRCVGINTTQIGKMRIKMATMMGNAPWIGCALAVSGFRGTEGACKVSQILRAFWRRIRKSKKLLHLRKVRRITNPEMTKNKFTLAIFVSRIGF
jgi:hypothetical protein